MKTQIESIAPVFAADTSFTLPMKSVPKPVELFDDLLDSSEAISGIGRGFEFRGVPESALHD